MQQHLFIINSHNNHIIVAFIVFRAKYLINLFILFPHISHLFQLFEVSIFAPLEYTLAEKTNTIFKLNFIHISCTN